MTDAYRFAGYGEPLKVVKLEKVPKPTLGSDTDLLIKVKAAAINPADLLYIEGRYFQQPSSFPAWAGFEGSGVVEEAGKSSGFHVGQRVHFRGGSWAEYALVDAKTSPPVPLPDEVSFEEGAQITINPITVFGMILDLGVQKGEFLLQSAASSALGRILIQVAKLKGIKTINIVRRDEHIASLKAIGADYVINSEKDDVVAKVKEIAPEGIKYAVDAVAGKTGTDIVNTLAVEGKVLVYGLLSNAPIEVSAVTLIGKRPIITGFWLAPWLQENPDKIKPTFAEIVHLLATKQLVLESKTFDGKTQFADAYTHATTPGKTEKSILQF